MIRFEKAGDELHVLFNDKFATVCDVDGQKLPSFYSYRIDLYVEVYTSPTSWHSMDRMLVYALREG